MIALLAPVRRQTREKIATISRCLFARLLALHSRLSGHEPDPRDLDQWRFRSERRNSVCDAPLSRNPAATI